MKSENCKCMKCNKDEKETQDILEIKWEFGLNTQIGTEWVLAHPILTLCEVCHDWVFMGEGIMAEHKLNAIAIKQKYPIGEYLN